MRYDVLYIFFSLQSPQLPPPWVMVWGRAICPEGLYRRDIDQIPILGENWHFRWGWFFFQVGFENFLYKNSEFESKKNYFDRIFYNFSLLVPYPKNFLVACIYILVFHGIYSLSPSTNNFLLGLKSFFYLVARVWENFRFLGDFFYWGDLICFFGEGGRLGHFLP